MLDYVGIPCYLWINHQVWSILISCYLLLYCIVLYWKKMCCTTVSMLFHMIYSSKWFLVIIFPRSALTGNYLTVKDKVKCLANREDNGSHGLWSLKSQKFKKIEGKTNFSLSFASGETLTWFLAKFNQLEPLSISAITQNLKMISKIEHARMLTNKRQTDKSLPSLHTTCICTYN